MSKRILLTGATGYVGGRLLGRLLERGYQVRCLVRRADEFRKQVPCEVEVASGDLLSRPTLDSAFVGIDQSFYLVHSMASNGFEEKDRDAARNFALAAEMAQMQRIVYLGGLGDTRGRLSPHLRSRQEVGDTLRSSSVEVIELKASIIIGSGSLSFEMIRHLTERLPVMITPKWVSSKTQPIAIGDVLEYLLCAIELPPSSSRIYEIGGADIVSYGQMIQEYARQRGFKRYLIPVPVLSPRLSSLWLALVTPLYARVGRKLVESLKCSTTVEDPRALEDFPIKPMGIERAIRLALANEEKEFAESHWSDAFSSSLDRKGWGGVRFGARLVDARSIRVQAHPKDAFGPIQRIGGKRGWYFANWLWKLRGWIDLLVGGVGMKRGRRDPLSIKVGDVIDCWRVETFEPSKLLRLRAEMKLPGLAWLEFEVTPKETGSLIQQTAVFYPHGLWGLAYWYGVYPLHQLVFMGMLRRIAAIVKRESAVQLHSGVFKSWVR